jgi:mitogen-activated protein kinase kinase
MDLDKSLSAMSLNNQDVAEDNKPPTRVMPPRPMPPRMPGRSVLPPMSRPGVLPPMSGTPSPGRSPVPGSSSGGGMRNRPGMGRMGKPGLNLSQLGLSPKPEQTPFANFSKYV